MHVFPVGYAEVEVTPQMLWDVICNESSTLATGHITVAGLPYCYKTTLVKRLLSKAGPVTAFRGDPLHLQMFEAILHEHPLTKEKEWESAEGLECAVIYISAALARHCFLKKMYPVYPKNGPKRLEDVSVPEITDSRIKSHFWKVYQEVKALIEKKRRDQLVHLALSRHVLVNILDVGVNRALYDIFPGIAGCSKQLFVVDVCDLERDVPNLDYPPDLSQKDEYRAWRNDEHLLQLYPRLYYLTQMAGVKQWYNRDPPRQVPQAVIVGIYRREFRERNEGEKLKRAMHTLQSRVRMQAQRMGVADIIHTDVVAICIDEEHGDAAEREIEKLREVVEKMMHAQLNFEVPLPVRWIFLRSFFYGHKSSLILKSDIASVGLKCGVLLEADFDGFLEVCRNGGSFMYYPETIDPLVSKRVILDVVGFVQQASRLYYLQRFVDRGEVRVCVCVCVCVC